MKHANTHVLQGSNRTLGHEADGDAIRGKKLVLMRCTQDRCLRVCERQDLSSFFRRAKVNLILVAERRRPLQKVGDDQGLSVDRALR